MELGESTRGGAARETMEESPPPRSVPFGALLAVYNPGQVQILYLAEVGVPRAAVANLREVECGPESPFEAAYFALDDPPEEDEELAFPTVKWALSTPPPSPCPRGER